MEYVESGFRAVAGFLSSLYDLKEDVVYDKAIAILKTFGRGKVFDNLLESLNIFDDDMVRLLIYIYRTHRPVIHAYEDVVPVIELLRLRGVKTGLITNGMAIVQQNKVTALGIAGLFDVIIYTDAFGAEYWKPSPVPFKMAVKTLRCPAVKSIYVGDDPSKDFLAPNALGMKTVQIIRSPGIHKPTPEGQGYAAQTTISSLSEYFSVAHENK
uniref:HAD family hydrolase n=1 Tax=uncultured Nitrospirae bacterium MY2-1F TaxID=798576 RepID=D9MNX7_9BACT|nr:HAD family hydrolase [uncultured Nitrospirae bacterium MY2-1F]